MIPPSILWIVIILIWVSLYFMGWFEPIENYIIEIFTETPIEKFKDAQEYD